MAMSATMRAWSSFALMQCSVRRVSSLYALRALQAVPDATLSPSKEWLSLPVLNHHLPQCLGLDILACRHMLKRQYVPASGKERLDGGLIEEPLRFALDQVEIRLDLRVTDSAEIVVFRGIEAAKEDAIWAQCRMNARDESLRFSPRKVMQGEAGDYGAKFLRLHRQRLTNVSAFDLCGTDAKSRNADCCGRKVKCVNTQTSRSKCCGVIPVTTPDFKDGAASSTFLDERYPPVEPRIAKHGWC
jgi:hypothetical protein